VSIPKKNYTKVSIGKEVTSGVAVAPTTRVPVSDVVFIKEDVSKSETNIITGKNFSSGFGLDAISYSTEMSSILSANKSNEILFECCFGTKSAEVNIGGGVRLGYIGDKNSCKLEVTENAIKSYIGEKGLEVIDTDFGTAGTYSLVDKTIDSLVSDLNSGNYICEIINGSPSLNIDSIVNSGIYQGKDHLQPLFFSGTDAALIIYTPNLTRGENPTVTLLSEGTGENTNGIGAAVNSMSLSADLKAKALVSYSLKILQAIGTETTFAGDLSERDTNPMKFNAGTTVIAGKKWDYCKNLSLEINNNIADEEGWKQGSLTKDKHMRGAFDVSGSFTITTTNSDEPLSSEAERRKVASDLESSIQFEFKGDKILNTLFSQIIFDLPSVQYTNWDKSANDQTIDTTLDFTCVDLSTHSQFCSIYFIK